MDVNKMQDALQIAVCECFAAQSKDTASMIKRKLLLAIATHSSLLMRKTLVSHQITMTLKRAAHTSTRLKTRSSLLSSNWRSTCRLPIRIDSPFAMKHVSERNGNVKIQWLVRRSRDCWQVSPAANI
jgi:hypothetical protein